MDHYLEIHLRPDPEFGQALLMNALFAKLHRALAMLASQRIGVSFPCASCAPIMLGDRLRLHGTQHDLDRLQETDWLSGMRDHAHSHDPRPVPTDATNMLVRRIQAKSNPERLRRRWIRRTGGDERAAHQAIPDTVAERLRLPYVSLHSQTTGQQFRLFIDQQPLPHAVQGVFSCYGLSTTATVPWF